MFGLSRRQLVEVAIALICAAAISWLALEYFIPAPPSAIRIATGSPNQTYEAIGKKYRDVLARSGIKVDVLNTPGAVQNLKLLNESSSGVQVAIVQGGVGNSDQYPDLQSLGRITYQFFWIFYRGSETLEDLR